MCTIPNMQAALFAVILEDAIIQLRILAECQNELRTYKTQEDMNLLVPKKYNVEEQKGKTELCDINPKKIDCDYYKINKTIADRMLCYQVFSDTYLELALNKTYSPLIMYKQFVQNQSDHVAFLSNDKPRNMIIYRERAKQLRLQRNRIKSASYDITTATDRHVIRTKDATLKQMVKERYIDHWQDSRAEQSLVRIKKNEGGLSESITCYRKKHDDEQRIHYELELLNNIQLNETLKGVDAIMVKYDNDIEAVEVRIQKIHSYYEDQITKRRELEQKLADHKTAVRDWLQFKKDREKTRLRKVKLNQAAIVVQAWWRGLLVRLKLGPYKKKKRILRKGYNRMYKLLG